MTASGSTFTVDAAWANRRARMVFGGIGVLVLVALIALVVAAATTDQSEQRLFFAALAVVAVVFLALLVRGLTRLRGSVFSLVVSPDQLVVTALNATTVVPAAAIEYGAIIGNGPLIRRLEVRLRPEAPVAVSRAHYPSPSTLRDGYVTLFQVSDLREQEAACLAAVAQVIELR